MSEQSDALIEVLGSKTKLKGLERKSEEGLPEDERTISIPKKYLKGFREGSIVNLKIMLDEGDTFLLLPEIEKPETQESLEEEITKIKDSKNKKVEVAKEAKKGIKEILSEEIDKVDTEDKNEGEK